MPNWCSNYVVLTSSKDNIQKITNMLKAPVVKSGEGEAKVPGLFGLFHPCPPDLLDTIAGSYGDGTPEQAEHELREKLNLETYGFKNWYDWCCENWSTKWDVFPRDISVEESSDTSITLRFDTAWGPPTNFYEYIVDNCDFTVESYYIEEGNGFGGRFSTEDGVLIDTYIEYSADKTGFHANGGGHEDIIEALQDLMGLDASNYYTEDEDEDVAPEHENPLIAQLHREGLAHLVEGKTDVSNEA